VSITARLVQNLIEEAFADGCVTSGEVHDHVVRRLRGSGCQYTFDELFALEQAHEREHPGSYPALLYTWEEACFWDRYATDGVRYAYLSARGQLYSAGFHAVSAGFGHGGTGKYRAATWDCLLKDVKAHPGKLEEGVWRQVCADHEQHPEWRCAAFEALRDMLSRRT